MSLVASGVGWVLILLFATLVAQLQLHCESCHPIRVRQHRGDAARVGFNSNESRLNRP